MSKSAPKSFVSQQFSRELDSYDSRPQKGASPRVVVRSSVGVSTILTALLCIGCLFVLYSLPPNFYDEFSLTGARDKLKPFKTFEDFYPFYLSEHSDLINRQLHLVGTSITIFLFLLYPVLIECGAIAGTVAYVLCTLLQGLNHGIVEGVVLFVTFLTLAKLNGFFKQALFIVILAYSFAWVGHFMFEHNKPATFIYPSYSLMGDIKMWFDAVILRSIPGIPANWKI